MHADGPRAVGPHGKPVEASASTAASDVGDIWKTVSKNLKLERMSTSQLRNRLENILNEINKENSEHMIAVVHPNVQECEVKEVSQPKPSDLESKKTFCSKRLGRCPHCRKRMDVSKIPEIRNRLQCQRKTCGKITTKQTLCDLHD